MKPTSSEAATHPAQPGYARADDLPTIPPPVTTKLYDRPSEEISLDEIEKITI